ncbi:hypothetical protein EDD15DRAFT_2199805 [Pisolithus albus]|nr:hypothetical protein EDD15DRAFT_2199805 [Pisolithus albus]
MSDARISSEGVAEVNVQGCPESGMTSYHQTTADGMESRYERLSHDIRQIVMSAVRSPGEVVGSKDKQVTEKLSKLCRDIVRPGLCNTTASLDTQRGTEKYPPISGRRQYVTRHFDHSPGGETGSVKAIVNDHQRLVYLPFQAMARLVPPTIAYVFGRFQWWDRMKLIWIFMSMPSTYQETKCDTTHVRRAVDHVIVACSTPTFARLLSPSKRAVENESRGGDVSKVGKSAEPNEEGRGDGAQAGRFRITRHWYTVVFEAGTSRIGKRCRGFSGIEHASYSSTSSGTSVAVGDEVAGAVVRCGHSPVIEAFVGEFATVRAAEHEFSDSIGNATLRGAPPLRTSRNPQNLQLPDAARIAVGEEQGHVG